MLTGTGGRVCAAALARAAGGEGKGEGETEMPGGCVACGRGGVIEKRESSGGRNCECTRKCLLLDEGGGR